jgi:hypothetical protein
MALHRIRNEQIDEIMVESDDRYVEHLCSDGTNDVMLVTVYN